MSYPSDLTDAQWELIKDNLTFGKYRKRAMHEERALVNSVFYLTKTRCQWRQLPKDFPPWGTAHSFYHRMKKRGIWEKKCRLLSKKVVCKQASSQPLLMPSLIIKVSKQQTRVRPEALMGVKKVKRRKRHISTNILDHMLHGYRQVVWEYRI